MPVERFKKVKDAVADKVGDAKDAVVDKVGDAKGAVTDKVGGAKDAVAAKLETCVVALQNIKLDLIRLNAGSQTPQHITSLAMDALNLADSVDSALMINEEMRQTGTRQASRPAAR